MHSFDGLTLIASRRLARSSLTRQHKPPFYSTLYLVSHSVPRRLFYLSFDSCEPVNQCLSTHHLSFLSLLHPLPPARTNPPNPSSSDLPDSRNMVARSATLATLAQAQLSPTSSSFPITIPTIPDDVSKTMPPPPVPAPVRTHSSSTASSLSQPSRVSSQTTLPSTVSSTARSSLSPKLAPALVLPLVPPGSPLRKASNERMSFASGSATGVCGGVVAAKPPAKTDDLDRLGYVYSLRVA